MLRFSSLTIVFFIFLGISPQKIHGQEEAEYGLKRGDFSISVGAGKNKFYHEEFELVAPYMANLSLDYAILNRLEFGLEYAPVFFADRSNVNFANTSAAKNQNFGGIQSAGANLKYGFYNDYGVFGYFVGGGKYNILDRNQYVEGQLRELDGKGYNIVAGLGVRYQLGDEHGDVFPWFFELSLLYNRNHYSIENYQLDGIQGEASSKYWNNLDYNGLDVIIRFGYRFRNKK